MYWFDKYDIVLGSGSPRRKSLMEEAGFKFTVMVPDADESFPEDMPVAEVAVYLAEQKSAVFRNHPIPGNRIIITADSIVILDNQILGKPKSAEDAKFMLSMIAGKQHQVITGVCLLSQNSTLSFSCKTMVEVNAMSEEEIDYYIKWYQPFDKAGSYGIQEWLGLCKISSIEGSYTNVMGLPMEQLYHELMTMI